MKLTQLFWCALGKHHRQRSSVEHDGINYRGVCEGCSKPMIRDSKGWAAATPER